MTAPKKVSVLGFAAYGSRGWRDKGEQRGMIRGSVVLDYLKGAPTADATLSIDQALRLQVELAKAIRDAYRHERDRRSEEEVPF